MSTLIFDGHRWLLTSFLALLLPMQEYVRAPSNRSGVGASGTIGRGTDVGERFIPRESPTWAYPTASMPVQAAPAWVYSAPPVFAEPYPAPARFNPAEMADREPIGRVDLAVTLPALARDNPYRAYHRAWFNGYWTASRPGPWAGPTPGPAGAGAASGKGPIAGLGLGWSLPAWLIGPMAYRWGYLPYANPFDRGGPSPDGERTRADDYSRPIRILSSPPTETLLDDALTRFRAARTAFRGGDLPRALKLTDEAIGLLPDDPLLHQFRALVLFALRRYEESAAALYAVLAVNPGWDWRTMIELYGAPETYTRQLRLLEADSEDHPRAMAARFVRAYHYLTTGYVEEALAQWSRVIERLPNDPLTMQLMAELRPSGRTPGDRVAPTPTGSGPPSAAPAGSSGRPRRLEGAWIALPRSDTAISLTFQPRGHVAWKVRQPGRDRGFAGYAIFEKKTLILSEDHDNFLVGTVEWQDDGHFTFKALGDRPGEPGLTFAKVP